MTPASRSLALLYRVSPAALLSGSLLAVLAAGSQAGGSYADGFGWSLYMLGTAAVSAILGLIFAIPRARSEYNAEASERYSANSNLEQISDWLTKILVGAGLVQLGSMPTLIRSAGDFLGRGMQVSNPSAFAASALVYGGGVGFLTAYLWTRLTLRRLLEASDRDAAAASRRADRLTARLRQADKLSGEPTAPVTEHRRVAEEALASAMTSDVAQRPAVLWVDDQPSGNTAIVESLTSLGIEVDLALSTHEALRAWERRDYGVVISDLGRRENGVDDDLAGLHLIEALRERGSIVPVIVYGGARTLAHREALLAAGATEVTDRPSHVFQNAVTLLTS